MVMPYILTEADYGLLRTMLGKDDNHIESLLVESLMEEEEYYPAGSIVILRDGRLGMAQNAIWQPYAFEDIRGARQARRGGDLPFPARYIGTHGEELLGAMGTVLVETDIRVLLLEGDHVDDEIIYVERGEIAWVLETPSEELQRIYINLLRWALDENVESAWRMLRTLALLAPFQLWKEDIEEELLLFLAPLARMEDLDRKVIDTLLENASQILELLLDIKPKEEEVKQMNHAQAPAPAQPQQQAAPQPQTQQPRVPRGPHAVVVEGNQVLAFAPFEPIWRGQRYSIPPNDERIRKLAERCQQLRKEGRNVALRFIVNTPAS